MMDHFGFSWEIGIQAESQRVLTRLSPVYTHKQTHGFLHIDIVYNISLWVCCSDATDHFVFFFFCDIISRDKIAANVMLEIRHIVCFRLQIKKYEKEVILAVFLWLIWDHETWLQHTACEEWNECGCGARRGSSFSPHTEPLQSWITELEKQLIALSSWACAKYSLH